MKVAGTEINLKNKAFEIYLSGCKGPHCKGCHNPELWTFDIGVSFDPEQLTKLHSKLVELHKAKLVDYTWVLGGEPQDQSIPELALLLGKLKQVTPVMLWTHYNHIHEKLLPYVDYVKFGPYIEGGESYIDPIFGIKLANREQHIMAM